MKNFLISAGVDIVLIFIAYYLFKNILNGPIRHKIYEKIFSSMAKFIIYVFLITIGINAIIAFSLYRTSYIAYINIIAPAVVSILVGFLMSTVPTRGTGDSSV
ncbi:hypothetical protein GTH52_12635 [Clostridium tyrobutyricum]|uniref:FIG028593: membrane protein n=1 Tax=Clostridium tyrobutyricum DIVETGP TaxID=1408889 RepID=W6N4U8_CLOTY|nr:hypothetical protein [Clostridium tyrobutyricum]AND86195.1 hypothetical protein CTK_C29570 [Clostridium tyrobutyricum]ANP70687.1 hypothetical protein BA182_13745 [Clostridium tyrobutyricum]MBR9648242.1 hypothetical protein [Clostridium tyrobutyricum]MBV4416702.1 hypothetical protein [Clostridium tyrobutyricum]MBV4422575.1 hypothetical protein [Clostridium tyrobutyricum]